MKILSVFLYAALMLNFGLAYSAIEMVQLRVVGANEPNSAFAMKALGGEFDITDQTSYLLPVVKGKVEGNRMPFIKDLAHDVLLVGPWLDFVGEVTILDFKKDVIFKISGNSLTKGKTKFYYPSTRKTKDEGFLRFRISEANMKKIKGYPSFTIRVGNKSGDNLQCKLVQRYEIEAILFTGNNLPTREVVNRNNVSTILNTFNADQGYNVSLKLRGGSLDSDKYAFVTNRFLYTKTITESYPYYSDSHCDLTNFSVSTNRDGEPNITTTRIVNNNDAISVPMIARKGKEKVRRAASGFMIGLYDANAGSFDNITMEPGFERFRVSFIPKKSQVPDFWGPYLLARISSNLIVSGQYTDLGAVKIGTCGVVTGNRGRGNILAGGSNPQIIEDPALIELSFQNALIYESTPHGEDDDFGNININICRQANDPNPKITNIGPLKAVVQNPLDIAINGTFTINFMRGNTVLFSENFNGLPANGRREVNYNRPENRICTTNPPSNAAVCKRCGNGISGVNHWNDENIVIQLVQNNNVIKTVRIPAN